MVSTALDDAFREQLLVRRRRLERFAGERPASAALAPGAGQARQDLLRLLGEVDAALGRLDAGTFGMCDVCQGVVEPERLLADPLCRVCLDDMPPEQLRALEHDLETAGRVQAALLPERDLVFDGWEVHCSYVPLGPVSGDYFDVVRPRTGEGLFFLGDVAGKGVAASLLMSHLHAIFRSLAGEGGALSAMVARANRVFAGATSGSAYATLVCGRVEADGGLELVNAGHCPALLLKAGGLDTVSGTGFPVGLFCEGDYATVGARLARGDALVLYTDGVSEALSGDGREFGSAGVASAVEKGRGTSAAGMVEAVLSDLSAFRGGAPLHDDVTVMAIRRVA